QAHHAARSLTITRSQWCPRRVPPRSRGPEPSEAGQGQQGDPGGAGLRRRKPARSKLTRTSAPVRSRLFQRHRSFADTQHLPSPFSTPNLISCEVPVYRSGSGVVPVRKRLIVISAAIFGLVMVEESGGPS